MFSEFNENPPHTSLCVALFKNGRANRQTAPKRYLLPPVAGVIYHRIAARDQHKQSDWLELTGTDITHSKVLGAQRTLYRPRL